jgi:hypothetical protein
MERFILCCLISWGLAPVAWACSTDAWNGGISGAATPASPPDAARVSELCGLRLTNTGYVQDNSPAHAGFIARFYVLPQLTGSGEADLFIAYSSETPSGVLFDIAYNGTNFVFDASGTGGVGSAPAVPGWNLIEVEFNSGGTFSFWLNSDATTDAATGSFASSSGTVQAIRLGLPSGRGGFTGGAVTFDAYESHATTPVGPLLIGDSNGSGAISGLDLVVIQNEILGFGLASGQPDCNRNGAVSGIDLVCVQNIILGN